MIYFNNCFTSKPAPEVIDAMLPYLKEKFQFPENFIQSGTEIEADISHFKSIIADSMNANSSEIHITRGGTAANNLAVKGFLSQNAEKGTHIIVSVGDYPDLLTNAAFFEKSGFSVTYLPIDSDGFIDLQELKEAIRDDTILMMTTLANHTVGTIQPIQEIRALLNEADHPIALHVDACQAFARMPIDVKEMGIDMMSISGHKIHSDKGIGALYVRNGIKLGMVSHGIYRIDNLETGGISIASLAGFAKAIELAFLPENMQKIQELSDYLLTQIEENIPHIMLNGARGKNRISHNVNVSFDYIEGEAMMMMLDLAGITVATGSACASQGLKPNYILMAMGRNHEQSHGSLKFTLSRYNTKEEIDVTVKKLAEIVKELRKRSPLYNQ